MNHYIIRDEKGRIKKGSIPPFKGKTIPLEIRQKISESSIGRKVWNTGKKELRIEVLKKQSISHIGKKISEEARQRLREARKGEGNPNWKKDRTKLKRKDHRKSYADLNWKRCVKKRDNNKCMINNGDCRGHLEAHHILPYKDFPELRYDINNGISLCYFHHPRKNSEVLRLSPYFQSLISNNK